ncbi:MBL fold metallo-hydrolase [Virgibacillus halophilus]|uniref:MBL fold metallo-hydrolase n=1 Tax=Tigheibacillus halophilus TaxID=361280 RepID=A0ABU5C9L4_9BACI|nr:MBL fold metallo-hydrolase [Virgibacillus halophilus]
MLVDTGPRIQKQQLKKVFSAWNVQQVALTHSHEDHTGMASWIAKHKNADIFCHERMVKAAARKAHLPWYRELFIGPRFGFSAQAYPNVLQTSKHQFLPIETPGHTTDHICLFEPDKGWLFTGGSVCYSLSQSIYERRIDIRLYSIHTEIKQIGLSNDFLWTCRNDNEWKRNDAS